MRIHATESTARRERQLNGSQSCAATDGSWPRLCKNVWRFFQIARKGEKTPT
jgi:hypothetical protein